MYVNVHIFKPTKINFYLTAIVAFALSVLMMLNPEFNDGFILARWALAGSVIYSGIGMFILFGAELRDSVFGFTTCPHCERNGWNIKQKLKLTKIEHSYLGGCSFCNRKGSISNLHLSPFLTIIILWVPILVIADGVSIASFVTYVLAIGYLFYFGRYVPVRP